MSTRTAMSWSYILGCAAISAALPVVVVAVLACYFGSLSLALAYIKGDRFAVLPTVVDFGKCKSESEYEARATVCNLSSAPVRVVGAQTGCRCITVENLPIAVEPGARRELLIRVKLYSDEDTDYRKPIVLFLDDGRCQSVGLHLRARIIAQGSK